MLTKTEFAEIPENVVVEHRLDGEICDIWIRDNIETQEREYGVIYIADEAYMQIEAEDCPEIKEIQEHMVDWFELAKEWEEPKELTIAELQAKIDYLEILVKER